MNTKLGAFFIVAFAIIIMAKTVEMFRKDKLSTRLFILWLLTWFAVGFFALFPSMLDKIMKFLNMGDRPFFITIAAILVLYMMIFYITSNIARANRRISKLVQETAILEYKLKNLSKGAKDI